MVHVCTSPTGGSVGAHIDAHSCLPVPSDAQRREEASIYIHQRSLPNTSHCLSLLASQSLCSECSAAFFIRKRNTILYYYAVQILEVLLVVMQ